MDHITYHKINTLYKRDEKGKIIIGDFSLPEFEYLFNNKWEVTEKIDGINMSYYWDGHDLEIHGKTTAAQIPSHLLDKMKSLITKEMMNEIFPKGYDSEGNEMPFQVIIYGEGYGMKIQKGGNYIKNDVSFRVFDININGYWLDRDSVEDICSKLNLELAPLLGIMTLKEAENLVKNTFKSTIAENKDYQAEGVVCKPIVPLYSKNGKRIIVKIKSVDYIQNG
jgi:ATP-dependent RNA circularization protein (DNA/RNA ligase family)